MTSDNLLSEGIVEFRRDRERREGNRAVEPVADPLGDRALRLGRWLAFESSDERRKRIERKQRLNMILGGASAEEIGRSAPQCTVDAILHAVSERGLVVLDEAANIERLSRCDAAALGQINHRVQQLLTRTREFSA